MPKKIMSIQHSFSSLLGQKVLLGLLKAPSVPLFSWKQATGSNGLLRYLDQEITTEVPSAIEHMLTLGEAGSAQPWSFVTGINAKKDPIYDTIEDGMTLSEIRAVVGRVDSMVSRLRALSGTNDQDPTFVAVRQNVFTMMGLFNTVAKQWTLQVAEDRSYGPYFRLFDLGSLSEFWPITEFSKGSNTPVQWTNLQYRVHHSSNILFNPQLQNGEQDAPVLADYMIKGGKAMNGSAVAMAALLRRAAALGLVKNVVAIASEIMRVGASKTETQNFVQVTISLADAMELLCGLAVFDVLANRVALVQTAAGRLNAMDLFTMAFNQPELKANYERSFQALRDFTELPINSETVKLIGSEISVPYLPEDPDFLVAYTSLKGGAGSDLTALTGAMAEFMFDPMLVTYYKRGASMIASQQLTSRPFAIDTKGEALPVSFDHLPTAAIGDIEGIVTKPLIGPFPNLTDGWYKCLVFKGGAVGTLATALPYNRGAINCIDLEAEFNRRLATITSKGYPFSALRAFNLPIGTLKLDWGFEAKYLYIGARPPMSVKPLNQTYRTDVTSVMGELIPVTMVYAELPIVSNVTEENFKSTSGFRADTSVTLPIGSTSDAVITRACSIAGVNDRPIIDAIAAGRPLPSNYPPVILDNIVPDYSKKVVVFKDLSLHDTGDDFAEEDKVYVALHSVTVTKVSVINHSLTTLIKGVLTFSSEESSIPLAFMFPRTGWNPGLAGPRGGSFLDSINQ